MIDWVWYNIFFNSNTWTVNDGRESKIICSLWPVFSAFPCRDKGDLYILRNAFSKKTSRRNFLNQTFPSTTQTDTSAVEPAFLRQSRAPFCSEVVQELKSLTHKQGLAVGGLVVHTDGHTMILPVSILLHKAVGAWNRAGIAQKLCIWRQILCFSLLFAYSVRKGNCNWYFSIITLYKSNMAYFHIITGQESLPPTVLPLQKTSGSRSN